MNAGGAHFGEAFHAPLRAALPAAGAPFSIRILINWRRPHLAIDASGDARADRPCVRRDKRLRLTDIPGFAWSPVLFRRGLCRRDHSNNRQRSCVHGQCEKPYRKFADAPLPLRRNTTKIGLQMGNANPNATRAGSSTGRRGLVPVRRLAAKLSLASSACPMIPPIGAEVKPPEVGAGESVALALFRA